MLVQGLRCNRNFAIMWSGSTDISKDDRASSWGCLIFFFSSKMKILSSEDLTERTDHNISEKSKGVLPEACLLAQLYKQQLKVELKVGG